MKRIITVMLAILLLASATACGAGDKLPDGYVEMDFCDLHFAVPGEWEPLTWEDESQNHLSYSYEAGDVYTFPLDVSAYDAVKAMADLAIVDMVMAGDAGQEGTQADTLERAGRVGLRMNTIEAAEQCEVGGAPAVRFTVITPSGYESVWYYVLTESYYYTFEFNYLGSWGDTLTDEITETIGHVMDSITVTPAE